MSSGKVGPTYPYIFTRGVNVSVVVSVLGRNTHEIAYVFRNSAGAVVISRASGKSFTEDALLATFCVECLNLSPVAFVPDLSRP
jgi:hypothetical protein